MVPVVALAAMVVAQFVVDTALGENYYTTHEWPKLAACAFTAAVLLFFGLWMNKPTGQVLVDKNTGAEIHVRPNHSFFFIPVQYWSAIVLAFGIYTTVV